MIISNFLSVALVVDSIRNQYIGRDKKSNQTNFLMASISEYVAIRLAECTQAETLIRGMANKFEASAKDYIRVKLELLEAKVSGINGLINYYTSIGKNLLPSIELFNKERELKPMVNQVFSELMDLRKYGVKTSAFQEGVLASPSDYWIFSDPAYILELTPEAKDSWQVRKHFEISEQNIIAKVHINSEKTLIRGRNLMLGNSSIGYSMESKATFSMNFAGEIADDTGHIGLSLRTVFVRRGHGELYELLKANTTFRLFDLVTPLTVQKKYEIPAFPGPRRMFGLVPLSSVLDPKLFLRRIRVLFDNRKEIKEELEIEIDESLNSRVSLLRREYGVICHIRKLPEGYKASEKARLAAKQLLNYNLKNGETFVCNYTKNKGGLKSDVLPLAVTKH